MVEKEKQQQQEIERLQKKIGSLSEAYQSVVRELEELKRNQKKPKKRGRPSIDTEKKARILALYQQGDSMRTIAEMEGVALSTVQKIVSEAAKKARVVYVYADREKPATIIDACSLTQKVKIVNLTDDMVSRAFGIQEKPDWEAYEEFLESRCMPGTRYGIREELAYMGIDSYDPFLIIQETGGRVYGDHQYLSRMKPDWIEQYDKFMEQAKNDTEGKERLVQFLKENEGAWMLDENQY